MRAISETYLLAVAGIAGTLIGAFLVGVFFYLDSELHRQRRTRLAADLYLRSGSRWVFLVYSIPLMVPLVLAGLEPVWGTVVFCVLSALLGVSTVDSVYRISKKGGSDMSLVLAVNEVTSVLAVLVLVPLPWVLGGRSPGPSDFVPSLLLAIGAGFFSTLALVMVVFDRTAKDLTEE